mgnify:CR=1 FL=1
MDNSIEFSDFEKVAMHVGKIIDVKPNEKAIIPAYILQIDFGAEIGIKISNTVNNISKDVYIDDISLREGVIYPIQFAGSSNLICE